MSIEGLPCHVLCDSGSVGPPDHYTSTIDVATFKRLWPNHPITPIKQTVVGACGTIQATRGTTLRVEHMAHAKTVHFVLLDHSQQPDLPAIRLGLDDHCALGVRLTNIVDFNTITNDLLEVDPNTIELDDEDPTFRKALQPMIATNISIPPSTVVDIPHSCLDLTQTEPTVIRGQKFPLSLADQELLDTWVNEMLTNTIIEPTQGHSPHNSAIFVSRQNKRKPRPVFDGRALNQTLCPGRVFQPEDPNQLLQRIKDAQIGFTIDLRSAFLQFRLAAESRPLTAFLWRGVQYQFARWPFGLRNNTGEFQFAMETFLQEPLAHIYVDDISAMGSYTEMQDLATRILTKLNAAGIRISPEKCRFGVKVLHILGHYYQLGVGRIADPTRIIESSQLPLPHTRKQLQHTIGLLVYLQEHVPDLARHLAPFTDKLKTRPDTAKKTTQLKWTIEEQKQFSELKNHLRNHVAIQAYDPQKPLILQTDASDVGGAAHLYQENDNGTIKLLGTYAKKWNSAQAKYEATVKEVLNALRALRKFEYYTRGRPVIIKTDHQAAEAMTTGTSRLVRRWASIIADGYDVKWAYIPGKSNIFADALSRIFPSSTTTTAAIGDQQTNEEQRTKKKQKKPEIALDEAATVEDQPTDPEEMRRIPNPPQQQAITKPESSHTEPTEVKSIPRQSHNNPKEVKSILAYLHRDHVGTKRMQDRLSRYAPNNNITAEQIYDFVQTCIPCQEYNSRPRRYAPAKNITSSHPFDALCMDVATLPDVNKQKKLLVVIDVYTRFLFVFPMERATASAITHHLSTLFRVHGRPQRVITDAGTEFAGTFKTMLTKLRITKRPTMPHNQQANGISERTIRTIKERLKKSRSMHRWPISVHEIAERYNHDVHATTGTIPFEMLYARLSQYWRHQLDAIPSTLAHDRQEQASIRRTQRDVYTTTVERKRREQLDKRPQAPPLHSDQLVYLHDKVGSNRTDKLRDGPYKTITTDERGARLRDSSGETLKHKYPRHLLYPAASTIVHKGDGHDCTPTFEDDNNHPRIRAIVSHAQDDKGDMLYNTQFLDGTQEWLPASAFDGNAVDLYHRHITSSNKAVLQSATKATQDRTKKQSRTKPDRNHIRFADPRVGDYIIPTMRRDQAKRIPLLLAWVDAPTPHKILRITNRGKLAIRLNGTRIYLSKQDVVVTKSPPNHML